MKKKMASFKKVLAVILIVLLSSGCGILKGVAESVTGNYANGIEQRKESGKSGVFVYNIKECFDKAKLILSSLDAKILKINQRRYYILAVVTRQSMEEGGESIYPVNSADVGVFLTEIEPNKTEVWVNSLSSLFVDYVSEKIFAQLEVDLEKEK